MCTGCGVTGCTYHGCIIINEVSLTLYWGLNYSFISGQEDQIE